MLRTMTIATLMACLGGYGLAQDRGKQEKKDKLKKMKAGAAVLKATAGMLKLKGYHVAESASAGGQGPVSFSGLNKGDFCKLEGKADVYARRDQYLIKEESGRFVPADQVSDRQAGTARNPWLFLMDLKKFGRIALWNGEDTVNGVECRIAESSADEKTMLAQINEFAKKSPELKRWGITNVSGFIDKKESRSLYKVYIGKEDLRIHKIAWELEPKIKKGSIPGGYEPPTDQLKANYELQFSKFNEDLDVDIPKVVKKKFKIK